MTSSLPMRAAELRRRLADLQQTDSMREEASSLATLCTELARPAMTYQGIRERMDLLSEAGIKVARPASQASVQKQAAAMLERFRAISKSATLKEEQNWPDLLKALEIATPDVRRSVLQAWKAYKAALFKGKTPDMIEMNFARTKENEQVLQVYKKLYAQFNTIFETLPNDHTIIDQARDLASQLDAEASNIKTDFSEDMKAFLLAVKSPQGAPISLLTENVLTWLRRKDNADSYRIKAQDAL